MPEASPSRRVRKSSPLSSAVSKHTNNTSSTRRSRQSNARSLGFQNYTQTQVSATSTLREDIGQSIDEAGQHLTHLSNGKHYQDEGDDRRHGPSSPKDRSNPPSPHLSVPSPTFHQSTSEAGGDGLGPGPSPREQEAQGVTIDKDESFSSHFENVGIPSDGVWDHNEAYDLRCCSDHRKIEFLLGTADRWMFAGDFDIPDAETKLEAMLLQHQDSPSEFDPHSHHCWAGCYGTLFSSVHSVVGKRSIGNEIRYLMRWQVYWTPESYINEKD